MREDYLPNVETLPFGPTCAHNYSKGIAMRAAIGQEKCAIFSSTQLFYLWDLEAVTVGLTGVEVLVVVGGSSRHFRTEYALKGANLPCHKTQLVLGRNKIENARRS
jgi:hypothetical protein